MLRREPARHLLPDPGGRPADDQAGARCAARGRGRAGRYLQHRRALRPPRFGTAESLAASYGKIVSLSSVAGRRGRPLQTHYAASKAAIISLTQSAALALAPYRINANAVCPGIVPTPMWQQIDKDRGQLFGAKPGEAMAAFINTVPLKRAATPEDIAAAVAFFCSSDADYITGRRSTSTAGSRWTDVAIVCVVAMHRS